MKNFKKLLLSALCVLAAVAVNGCKNSGPKAPSAAASLTEQIGDHSYKVVKINGKIWMAENLRNENISHYSANGDSSNDAKYGYLYTWENAQKACPSGWHLPSKAEFNELLEYVDNNKSSSSDSFLSLIANSTAWEYYSNQGLDEFGFGALPAGYYRSGYYGYFGSLGAWWSATEFGSSRAYYLYLGAGSAFVDINLKASGFSVRCLKDSN